MDKKMLVVYYSWSNGNTEKIAEQLADACGADICRIETIEPYPSDYDETVEQGHREVDAGYEPAIEALEFDPSDYDVIAVGTPTWWYTMAPAVKTFMGSVDWAGKTIVALRPTAAGRALPLTISKAPPQGQPQVQASRSSSTRRAEAVRSRLSSRWTTGSSAFKRCSKRCKTSRRPLGKQQPQRPVFI